MGDATATQEAPADGDHAEGCTPLGLDSPPAAAVKVSAKRARAAVAEEAEGSEEELAEGAGDEPSASKRPHFADSDDTEQLESTRY